LALAGDLDPALGRPGTFTMSGRGVRPDPGVPEIDRAAWLDLARPARRSWPTQRVFLDRLAEQQGRGGEAAAPAAD